MYVLDILVGLLNRERQKMPNHLEACNQHLAGRCCHFHLRSHPLDPFSISHIYLRTISVFRKLMRIRMTILRTKNKYPEPDFVAILFGLKGRFYQPRP
jgi:hypothetical protein